MRIAIRTKVGRYEILSPLGAGGMGEVYLAKDTRLERTVSLKILPAKVATDESRMRRFTQEARAASALSHPNVAHIYEIEEEHGVHFIAMEYIEGRTLRQHLKDSPLLSPREALEIAMQVVYAIVTSRGRGFWLGPVAQRTGTRALRCGSCKRRRDPSACSPGFPPPSVTWFWGGSTKSPPAPERSGRQIRSRPQLQSAPLLASYET